MKTLKFYNIFLAFLFTSSVVSAQWNAIPDFPLSTDGTFSFVINSKAYINGGLASNDFYSFDESSNQWTKLADVPSLGASKAWAFTFAVNGKGYIAGGSYASASDLEKSLWEYDPVSNKWTQKADFPGGVRDGGYSFAIGNKGYIGGGFDGQYLHNDLYEYDPVLDKWTPKAVFPGGPVIFPASLVINGKGYVGTGDQGGVEIQQFWEYDPGTNNWTRKADFPGDKRQTAIGYAIGNKGYIGGGMAEYKTNRKDFWEYDPVLNNWQLIYNAELPYNNTAWSGGFVIGKNIYYGLGVDFPAFTFSKKFYKREFSDLTGLKENLKESEIKLFPNPAHKMINFEIGNSSKILEIAMTDLKGAQISHLKIKSTQNEIDISSLQNGVYILKIVTDKGVIREKIIKQATYLDF